MLGLRSRCRFWLFDACIAAAFSQTSLLALGASGGSLGARYDVYNDLAVILAAIRTCAV